MEDPDRTFCKLCLVTDVKMYSLNTPSILEAYSQLLRVVICENFQSYICYECTSLLRKCEEFRLKCVASFNLLNALNMDHSKLTKKLIQTIDRNYYNLVSKYANCSILLCSNDQCLISNDSSKNINEADPYLEVTLKMDYDDPNNDTLDNIILNDDNVNKVIDSDITSELNGPKDTINMDTHDANEVDSYLEVTLKMDIDDPNNETLDNIILKDDNVNKVIDSDIKSHLNWPEDMFIMDGGDANSDTLDDIKNDKTSDETSNYCIVQTNHSLANDHNYITEIDNIKKTSAYLKRKNDLQKYVRKVCLTPDDAKKEMLLRKQSKNYQLSPYKCDFCYKGFVSLTTYDNHMKKHSPELGIFECDHCHLRFSKKKSLRFHIGHCHRLKYECKICPSVSYSTTQRNSHMNRHKGKMFECQVCGKRFNMSNSLSNHKRFKHPTETVCPLCGSLFGSLQGLKAHQKILHKQDSTELLGPKCDECDVQFATETAWKRHLVLSSKHAVSNGCGVCGETFDTKELLRIHKKTHPRTERNYNIYSSFKIPGNCKICNKMIETHSDFREHMKSAHPSSDVAKKINKYYPRLTPAVCEVCGKVAKNVYQLRDHQLTHINKRPFECGECGKRFAHRSSLNAHKNVHTRTQVYECDVCQKQYSHKQGLTKHIKNHFGIRPYECSYCHKRFIHNYERRTHIEYVHYSKPWPQRDRSKRSAKIQSVLQ